MLGIADRSRGYPCFPGHGNQPLQHLPGLHLAQPVSGIDCENGGPAPIHLDLGPWVRQPLLDAAHVDVQARDAMGGDAVDIGVHQGVGQDLCIPCRNPDGAGNSCRLPNHQVRSEAGQSGILLVFHIASGKDFHYARLVWSAQKIPSDASGMRKLWA